MRLRLPTMIILEIIRKSPNKTYKRGNTHCCRLWFNLKELQCTDVMYTSRVLSEHWQTKSLFEKRRKSQVPIAIYLLTYLKGRKMAVLLLNMLIGDCQLPSVLSLNWIYSRIESEMELWSHRSHMQWSCVWACLFIFNDMNPKCVSKVSSVVQFNITSNSTFVWVILYVPFCLILIIDEKGNTDTLIIYTNNSSMKRMKNEY